MVVTNQELSNGKAAPEGINPQMNRRADNVFLRDVDLGKYLILNGAQTFALDALFYPLDVVKTRLQVQDRAKEQLGDMYKMFRSLISKEGLRGLYSGFVPSMCGGYPGHAIYYVAFEWSRNYFDQFMFQEGHLHKHLYLDVCVSSAAGLVAEATSGLFWVPGDIISQRLQVRTLPGFGNPHHQGAIDVAKSISTAEGVRGFYRGYWPSLFIYAPGSAIWWAVYEFFKSQIHTAYDHYGLGQNLYQDSSVHLISGCAAGFCTSVYLNPLEVARTRYQVIEANNHSNVARIKRGFLAMLLDVGRNEGFHGLYRGFLPRLIVSVPGSSLSVVTYEFVKRICKVELDDKHYEPAR